MLPSLLKRDFYGEAFPKDGFTDIVRFSVVPRPTNMATPFSDAGGSNREFSAGMVLLSANQIVRFKNEDCRLVVLSPRHVLVHLFFYEGLFKVNGIKYQPGRDLTDRINCNAFFPWRSFLF